MEFEREADLLTTWRDFVEEVDPDLIIGYNISQFDLPYLIDRAKALKAPTFPYFGRLKSQLRFRSHRCERKLTSSPADVKTEVKDTHFSSKAYGNRDSKETSIDGRLQLDILQVMQRDYKLRSYTLNSVCSHFLGLFLPLPIGGAHPDCNLSTNLVHRGTKGGRSPLDHHRPSERNRGVSASTSSVLPQGEFRSRRRSRILKQFDRTPTFPNESWTSSCASSTTSKWRA